MNYSLHSPCQKCPFRTDIRPFITAARCHEILTTEGGFACHATVDYSGEEDGCQTEKTQHCAGVLIILERDERPHQLMRISERLGLYDRSKLNMDAPVYDSVSAAIEAHRKTRR